MFDHSNNQFVKNSFFENTSVKPVTVFIINELKQAIIEIPNGGSWFSNELLQNVIYSMNKKMSDENKIKLTECEIEVLKLVCKGLTAEKIGEELCLSFDTIRTYRANLLSKTECNNTADLVMYAIKNKIIEIN